MSSIHRIDFEGALETAVQKDCEADLADELISSYHQTKVKLRKQVYDNIPAAEPSLTDHGIRHVENVLRNAIRLLGTDGLEGISGTELYCLGMSILFHDAGNIYGRKGHRDRVARLHDKIRGTDSSLRREKTLIVRATKAHTGKAQDGSLDTLKEVSNDEHLHGFPVRLREVAAILRLADELAEGPQRTSELMQKEGLYESDSAPYHAYASDVHVLIESDTRRRIVLAYEIDLNTPDAFDSLSELIRERLEFAYRRIQKLNQERPYTRFYSDILRTFDSTEASFNFHHSSGFVDVSLDPLRLTDIVLPGDPPKKIADFDGSYALDVLVPRLVSALQARSPRE